MKASAGIDNAKCVAPQCGRDDDDDDFCGNGDADGVMMRRRRRRREEEERRKGKAVRDFEPEQLRNLAAVRTKLMAVETC